MSQQQTVLRVETNIVDFTYQAAIPVAPFFEDRNQNKFTTLDLYGDIPIKINKSIAEIQDISKRNSDLSIGLTLPGSKKNNRFFETFYNVDTQSLYFDPTSRVSCNVLLNDESYFQGYLRLNKINVLNSKVEYDVTLYSTVGNLFGEIGNNLLQDLDFDDEEYTFNHVFTQSGVTSLFGNSNFYKDSEYPYTYFYPIVHNGYEYTNVTGTTGGTSSTPLPNFTGVTSGQTRLYTSTSPIGSFDSYSAATSAGVEEYRINSPIYGLRDNQLKPGLNVWSLIKLIFKTYGYTIKSDFMNTPWMKSLYLYGYFSYEGTKFGWKVNNIQQLPPSGVAVYFDNTACYVVKLGTGIPCFCTEDINVTVPHGAPYFTVENGTIIQGTTGYTYTQPGAPDQPSARGVSTSLRLSYLPKQVGDTAQYEDGDDVTFDLVIDQNIKQIDLLSSIAKKFNLVFISDPDIPNQIIVEPYDFYIGSGEIYDWTPKLSWDKGFTVEPAQNFIESNLLLTDLEDGDEGNREFKNRVNRIYGQNVVYNPTDFKSQEKKIDTIFSPELIRRWDENIGLPLGINYSATSEIDKVDNQVRWSYKGVKTKPKLFYWVGTANPFIDDVNEVYSTTGTSYNTYTVKVAASNYTGTTPDSYERIPVVSHTMPLGLSDSEKINNDSLSILFNSELPVDIGVQTYNTYTENDVYNTFYRTRINNIYDPNTRLVSGYFDLKYSDIQNFQWNDVIKINEQYFTINKISEFNLTNRELTKVELIQLNLNPQQYVDRYFKYTYCDEPNYCFKLKTDFINPNLQDTNFIWSTYYDQQVGSLTGTTTGFTSTFRIFNTGSFQVQYVPYTMEEITETDYVSGSCYDSSCDTMLNYIYGNVNGLNFSLASFWENSADTFTGTNLWSNCAGFNSTNSTYVITTGSSTTYGFFTTDSFNGRRHFNHVSISGTGIVREVQLASNGDIFVGGDFDFYDNITLGTQSDLVKLNSDGEFDTTFVHPSVISGTSVRSIEIDSNNKILIGGGSGLLRLNTDGSIDTSFNGGVDGIGVGFVFDIEILSNEKILVGGGFDTYNLTSRVGIAKINTDGSLDTSLNSYFVTGITFTSIRDIDVFEGGTYDGKIVCGGIFTEYSGQSRNSILVLNSDGTLFTTFNPGTGFSGGTPDIQNVKTYTDGKILCGGNFTSYNGTSVTGLVKLNIDGTIDTGFTYTVPAFITGTTNDDYYTFENQSDGKIIVIASDGDSIDYVFRLNSNGTYDNTFNTGYTTNSGVSPFNAAESIAILPNDDICIGGRFRYYTVNGVTQEMWSIVKLDKDGNFLKC
jgi:uncharacterized delta-60 repeat protein